MASACLVGSTGLVGSHILSTLAAQQTISKIHVLSRKKLPNTSSKVYAIDESDSSAWPSKLPPSVPLFFSALGTTARQAGNFQKQREIDYDLNLSLAKSALKQGARIYILISTSGANPSSIIPYSKMKGELDEAVKQLGFEQTIILKPGLLVGPRQDSRPGEFMARKIANLLGTVSGNMFKDSWAQDAEVVARAAVAAGLEALDTTNPEKVRILDQKDIVRLGRTEWKA